MSDMQALNGSTDLEQFNVSTVGHANDVYHEVSDSELFQLNLMSDLSVGENITDSNIHAVAQPVKNTQLSTNPTLCKNEEQKRKEFQKAFAKFEEIYYTEGTKVINNLFFYAYSLVL